jgi:signal transduction histidine kinase
MPFSPGKVMPSPAPPAATTYTGGWPGERHNPLTLVLSPPMTRQTILRIMIFGFGLMVFLVLAAAYFGYQGSNDIQDSAQNLVREGAVTPERGAKVATRIETETQKLLDELTLILGLCFILALGGAVLTVWVTNRAFQRLTWQAEELNRVSWHLVQSHERISRRFSHEMHDELGQSLTGLKGMIKRANPQNVGELRGQMLTVLEEVMQSVRELAQLLRPVILDDFGLDAGLRWLTERFSQRTRIEVHYQSDFSERLSDPIETHLFRIGQEALTNIAKHSGATQAWVRLHVAPTRVTLEIEDNGHGMSEAPMPGFGAESQSARISLGMVGMRARVRQINGELKVENRKEGGLRIHAEVPREGPDSDDQQEDTDLIS